MIRQANKTDIDAIIRIYAHILDAQDAGEAVVGWVRGVYPTRQTALTSIAKGEMYVEENEEGIIVASGRINREQVREYADCPWAYAAADDEVMVLHTLTVDPCIKGRGYGAAFVAFYEELAAAHNCRVLRIDTNEGNLAARAFYKKLGFREAGIVPCTFNGIPNVGLVCLEKKL